MDQSSHGEVEVVHEDEVGEEDRRVGHEVLGLGGRRRAREHAGQGKAKDLLAEELQVRGCGARGLLG